MWNEHGLNQKAPSYDPYINVSVKIDHVLILGDFVSMFLLFDIDNQNYNTLPL
jgi:hypothetical protein